MSYKRQWWLSPFNQSFSSTKTFSRDVEFALQEKKKCKESNKKFISVVASAVLVYNRYPSASIYENVGWAVLSKYAFLQSLQEQLRYHYGNIADAYKAGITVPLSPSEIPPGIILLIVDCNTHLFSLISFVKRSYFIGEDATSFDCIGSLLKIN